MTTTHTPAPGRAVRAKPGLLINRNYGLLWIGQTVSSVGDLMLITTLAVSALQGLVIAALLVALGLTPLPLLDLLGIGPLSLDERLMVIYAAVFLVNACALFSVPSIVALIGDLVPEAQQAQANGVFQASGSLAILLGSAVAPPLFLALGPDWALMIDALSFFVVLLALLAVRAPRSARSVQQGARGHFLRELAGGIRFAFTNRVITTLLIGFAIAKLGFGALNALDVFFVTQNLHASPKLYGLAATAIGVGALLGAVLAGALAERVGLARMMWLSLTGMGVAMLVWSRMTSTPSARPAREDLSLGPSSKIAAWHRERLAVVYVRQSTAQQVLVHAESTRLQYGLVSRAEAYGWTSDRIVVIDDESFANRARLRSDVSDLSGWSPR